MRDPQRIDEILKTVAEIWKANPDLRLGQLITNAVPENMIYFVEDNKLHESLKALYQHK